MSAIKVILNIHGGLVQDVFCTDPAAEAIVCDWDYEHCDKSEPGMVEVASEHGRTYLAHVAQLAVEPIERLANTEVAQALALAGVLDGPTQT